MVLPPRTGMPLHFGISIISADKDKIVGEMQADQCHLNAFGILHGGALMAFGDELTGAGDRRVGAIACRAPHAGLADLDLWSRRQAGRPRDADPARGARGARHATE